MVYSVGRCAIGHGKESPPGPFRLSDAWLVRTQPGTVACSLAAVQIALEGAQKVKELCYIHAEGCAT